jgi:hypothetical protein
LLIILIIAASSIVMIKPAGAQIGVTNPSIPGFGVTLQTYQNFIPPTYGVDPSTGKAVMTKAGYTEIEKWVRVDIGGQPFLRYNNSAGQLISLSYDVRWKGNHDSSWQSTPQNVHFGDAADPWAQAIGCFIDIGFKGIKGDADGWMQLLDPTDTQIDFQVEALIGYYTNNNVFVGQTSGWSNTQTLTLSLSTSPTPTPTIPEFSSIAIQISLIMLVAVAGLLVYFKKRKGQMK